MKLEDILNRSFFYSLMIGSLLSIFIAAFLLGYFTTNYIDEQTGKKIIEIEKKNAKLNMDCINILLSNTIGKVQLIIDQQISFYNSLAKKVQNLTEEEKKNRTINNFTRNYYDLHLNESNIVETYKDQMKYMSFWIVDRKTNEKTLENNDYLTLKLQLSVYSNIIHLLHSAINSMSDIISDIFFLFDSTDLSIFYPVQYFYETNNYKLYDNYGMNPIWCIDENGEIIQHYKFKCRTYYSGIQKAKGYSFDNNVDKQSHRKLFLSSIYPQIEQTDEKISTLCIEFTDIFSMDNAYMCADMDVSKLIYSLEKFNEKIIGHYIVISVGYNYAFYYPNVYQLNNYKTPADYLFGWNENFYIEEKTNFTSFTQKKITSNYFSEIDKEKIKNNPASIFDEVLVNGNNSDEQYFYINGEKYYFSLYPILFEDMNMEKEHVLSIVYFYNNNLFYKRMFSYQKNSIIKIILEILLFIITCIILLYFVNLSFKLLAKYIVIPIKNANYMLKGINIGGVNRIVYLDSLNNKQEINIQKLKAISSYIDNKNVDKDKKIIEKKFDSFLNEDINTNESKYKIEMNRLISEENEQMKSKGEMLSDFKKSKYLEYNGEIIEFNTDYNKIFEKESDYIEKEIRFYNFDEELLQFRSLEIDRLLKSLINLKGALLLTSNDQQKSEMVNYYYSKEIFYNYKNKEGATLCQSNVGNLQSQLYKYDKAIYHLVLSIQDSKLKRFLSKSLSDELDTNDMLLYRIGLFFKKGNRKVKTNILVEKQQNNFQSDIPINVIRILIDKRYCKLIRVYFKFFSFIRKSQYEYVKLSEYFMHINFHTINYFHKILIQYIYLCYKSNDFIKMGESLLDYIEFLIKFKFKTSKENEYYMDLYEQENPEYYQKQFLKKFFFDKIIGWLSLFDNYAFYVKNSTSLCFDRNYKGNEDNNDKNSQSLFLFNVILQRRDFLKGKFALVCENYIDALYYFIRAAKKKSIVLDGLIKKRALNHIYKIAKKLDNNLNNQKLNHLSVDSLMKIKQKIHKIKSKKVSSNKVNLYYKNNPNYLGNSNEIIDVLMKNGLLEIKKNISECNYKQSKDVLIIIDLSISCNINEIKAFQAQAITILEKYLEGNDRYGTFFLFNQKPFLLCPITSKNKIDIENYHKDLKTNISERFSENNFNLNISINDEVKREIIEKYNKEDESFHSENENNSKDKLNNENSPNFSGEGLFNNSNKFIDEEIYKKSLKEKILSLNYCINYLKIKEVENNEKYLVFLTNCFNSQKNLSDELIEEEFKKIKSDKHINFLLVGKITQKNEKNIINIIIKEKFGKKSEILELMKGDKIRVILSSGNTIQEDITFPNELFIE